MQKLEIANDSVAITPNGKFARYANNTVTVVVDTDTYTVVYPAPGK